MAKIRTPRIDIHGLDPSAVTAKLNVKYGENTLVLASKMMGAKQAFVRTGIHEVDIALGGGFAKNRVHELRGEFSSMKSTVCYLTIAEHQKASDDNWAALIDVEKAFDVFYFIELGGDPDRLVVVNPDSGEQAVDVISDLLGTDAEFLLVVDSVAGLVPTAEIEGSMNDQFMGLHPRLINRLMRITTSRMKRHLYDATAPATTVLLINQLREKIGVMFGNPETTPGGKGKDFFCSTLIRFSAPRSKKVTEDITRNGVKKTIQIGQEVNFITTKNRCGVDQFAEGEFTWYKRPHGHYGQYNASNDATIFKQGLYYGVIVPKKGKFRIISTGQILPGKKNLALRELHKRPKLMLKLSKEIIAAMRAEAKAGVKAAADDDE